jgi:hypothetical protein
MNAAFAANSVRAAGGRRSFARRQSLRPGPERLGHDAENLGVVHLPMNTVASGANRGQDHVFARMHVGVDHRWQVAEAQYGTQRSTYRRER